MRPLILLALVLFAIAACNKKESVTYTECNPVPDFTGLISEEFRYFGPDTALYQRLGYVYDDAGRVLFQLQYSGQITDTLTRYNYSSGQVKVNGLTYYLNARGLADSTEYNLSTYRKTWRYDADGYMVVGRIFSPGSVSTDSNTYQCANRSTAYLSLGNSTTIAADTLCYSYYPGHPNTCGNENFGIHFLGRQDNVLLKSVTAGGGFLIASYRYTFDQSGRVAWETRTDEEGKLWWRRFVYR